MERSIKIVEQLIESPTARLMREHLAKFSPMYLDAIDAHKLDHQMQEHTQGELQALQQ